MAKNSKQCSDAAQVGPGVGVARLDPRDPMFSGGLGSSGNSTSGTSQSHLRGKQG